MKLLHWSERVVNRIKEHQGNGGQMRSTEKAMEKLHIKSKTLYKTSANEGRIKYSHLIKNHSL